MRVKGLEVEKFRNYSEAEIEFDPEVNIFIGKNAQGKTNILEAVYLLAFGKSYRAARDTELVKWGESFFRVKGDIERESSKLSLEVSFSQKGRKLVRLNGVEPIKSSKLSSFLNVVMFTPEDLNLVKGMPSGRRKFLDTELSQINPLYRSWISSYNRIVIQRNSLLKNYNRTSENLLETWNEQLVEVGSKIILKRTEFLTSLGVIARMIHRKITGSGEILTLRYMPSFFVDNLETVRSSFEKELESKRSVEIARGLTLVGPHRDDVRFDIDGVDAGTYGSQGQQRSVVLSLKIAEVNYIKSIMGEDPVLLLDDVLSELDETRRNYLVKEAVEKHQTIITSADAECVKILPQSASVYEVVSGTVKLLK